MLKQKLLNLIKYVFRMYFILFYKVKVTGLDNIPQDGKLIMTCNHLSNFDPPLAGGYAGLRRDSIYMIKKELMSWPLFGAIFRYFDFIPVDRKKPGGDLSSLKAALKVVKQGQSLFIFPEGTRSKTGKAGKAKPGVGFLVYHSGAQVLPIRIKGTEKMPFTRNLELTIGKPFYLKKDETREVKEQFQDFADQIMAKIEEL